MGEKAGRRIFPRPRANVIGPVRFFVFIAAWKHRARNRAAIKIAGIMLPKPLMRAEIALVAM